MQAGYIVKSQDEKSQMFTRDFCNMISLACTPYSAILLSFNFKHNLDTLLQYSLEEMAHQPTFLLWNLAHFRDIDGNKQKCLGWQSRETRLDSIENVKWTTSDLEKKLDLATASFNWFSHTCCLQYLLDLKKSLKVHRNSLVLVADKLFLMTKTILLMIIRGR